MLDFRKWALHPETPWAVAAIAGVSLLLWLAFRAPQPTTCVSLRDHDDRDESQVCLIAFNHCKNTVKLDVAASEWREVREIKFDEFERFSHCIKRVEPYSVKLCYADGTKCKDVALFYH